MRGELRQQSDGESKLAALVVREGSPGDVEGHVNLHLGEAGGFAGSGGDELNVLVTTGAPRDSAGPQGPADPQGPQVDTLEVYRAKQPRTVGRRTTAHKLQALCSLAATGASRGAVGRQYAPHASLVRHSSSLGGHGRVG